MPRYVGVLTSAALSKVHTVAYVTVLESKQLYNVVLLAVLEVNSLGMTVATCE